jgi:hypothetical protein
MAEEDVTAEQLLVLDELHQLVHVVDFVQHEFVVLGYDLQLVLDQLLVLDEQHVVALIL